jgi:hypothetical protein
MQTLPRLFVASLVLLASSACRTLEGPDAGAAVKITLRLSGQ